jgi:hypothetical protein
MTTLAILAAGVIRHVTASVSARGWTAGYLGLPDCKGDDVSLWTDMFGFSGCSRRWPNAIWSCRRCIQGAFKDRVGRVKRTREHGLFDRCGCMWHSAPQAAFGIPHPTRKTGSARRCRPRCCTARPWRSRWVPSGRRYIDARTAPHKSKWPRSALGRKSRRRTRGRSCNRDPVHSQTRVGPDIRGRFPGRAQ